MPTIHISDEILYQTVLQIRILFKTLSRLLPPQVNVSQTSCSPNASHLLPSLQSDRHFFCCNFDSERAYEFSLVFCLQETHGVKQMPLEFVVFLTCYTCHICHQISVN